MTEDQWREEWRTAKHPIDLWYHRSARSYRKRMLVACACARRILWVLGDDARGLRLLEACEAYVDASAKGEAKAWKAVVAARKEVHARKRECEREALRYKFELDGLHTVLAASVLGTTFAGDVFNFAANAANAPRRGSSDAEVRAQMAIFRDVFKNPFHTVDFSNEWRTATAVSLARQMYESRDFSALPILADALQDAGCEDETILGHCRGAGTHVRGCWVVDLVLGKE
jgi:hypothetical protein